MQMQFLRNKWKIFGANPSTNYKNHIRLTNKKACDFMVNHDQKNDSKIYHEIMPSLDQKIPYNMHEINSSKQVKFQYFFS